MRKLIIGLVVIAALLFAGWYFASPGMALSGMQGAIEDRDAEALSDYVDYPALRTSLKDEMRASVAQELDGAPKGLGQLGQGFAMAMADPMIDAMVTPQGLARLFDMAAAAEDNTPRIEPPKNAQNDTAQTEQQADEPEFEIERVGLDEFRVIDPGDPQAAQMVFRRDGIGWKLSGIDLP